MKIKIRQAKVGDIPEILEVERLAWREEKAATSEMIKSRIKTFPEGTLVALINGKIVGFISTQIVNYDPERDQKTWYEVTDNGFIAKTHNPKGDTLYGVTLSVHPSYQRKGVGRKILIEVAKLALKYNLKQGILGARIPNYHKFADKISVEDYVKLDNGKSNIPPDPQLLFYRRCGFEIKKIIPNYFKDPESLNFGILLVRKNPFYNKWYRGIIAKIFGILAKRYF